MLHFFLNPWMLAGLAGVMLPVIAHLLSRKKYDVVDWGAMQFLELDPSAKRRTRLEELLLMLLRMITIAIVALALARPWLNGQWLAGFVSTQSRDVVLVIDGSYSMGWEGAALTPRVQAQQLASRFLRELRPGDSIQLIDAREQPQVVFAEPTRDIYRVRETLNDLPAPSGSANLALAISKAIQILSGGTNLKREVIVFTDLQSLSWKGNDENLWARIDDMKSQSTIPPRIWVMDAANGELGNAPNFTLERLQLSRELAVVGVPVKISSKVKYAGGDEPANRKVFLEIDQQRINDQTVQLKIPPKGETTVDFEYRFETPGSHLISLVIENDALPGDNRSHSVVTVTDSIPVLLVDGDRKLDPTKCETYFASIALRSTEEEPSWIKASVIGSDELTIEQLKPMAVVVIANVASLNEASINALQQFAASGRGVLFTLGDKVKTETYREWFRPDKKGVFPCRLESLCTEDETHTKGVRVSNTSLDVPWLRPFRAEYGGSLGDARWSSWWKVRIAEDNRDPSENSMLPLKNSPDPLLGAGLDESSDGLPILGSPVIEARLTTGDPLIVSRRFGRGTTAVYTSSLDADWNTLPAKQDFVPFLHELLFSVASASTSRNVEVGSPLILAISPDLKSDDCQFINPENKQLPIDRIEDGIQTTARLRSASLPGVYRFVKKNPRPNEVSRPEYFAVDFDRTESDLNSLTKEQQEFLAADDRILFVKDLPDLRKNMFADSTRAEIWWILIYVFLMNLIAEAWMTRRMVRGGFSSAAT